MKNFSDFYKMQPYLHFCCFYVLSCLSIGVSYFRHVKSLCIIIHLNVEASFIFLCTTVLLRITHKYIADYLLRALTVAINFCFTDG
jgi:hypothetical protein